MNPARAAASDPRSVPAGSLPLLFWLLVVWAGLIASLRFGAFTGAVSIISSHLAAADYSVKAGIAAANWLLHLRAVLVALLLFAGMSVLGGRLLGWWKASPERGLLSKCLSFALGYGAVSFLLLGLLLVKLWFAAVILSVCGGLAAACALFRDFKLGSLVPDFRKPTSGVLLGLVSLALFIPWMVGPEFHVDGWEYFLAGPQRWLAAHGLSLKLATPPLNWPFFVELPYVFGIMAGHDAVPKFLSAAWVLCAMCAVFEAWEPLDWGRVLAGTAACGSLAFAFQTGKNDGIIAAQGLIVFACLAKAPSLSLRSRWVALAGTFAGFASASKYTGLLNVMWAPAAILLLRRPGSLTWMGGWMAVGVALGVPWYLKAFLTTGDPFYPMLSGCFPWIIHGWDERNAQVWRNWTNMEMPDVFFPFRFIGYLMRENLGFAWLAPCLFIWRSVPARAGLVALVLSALWHFLFYDPQADRWFFPTIMPAVIAVFAVSGEWMRGLGGKKAGAAGAVLAVLVFAATVQRFAGQFGIPNPVPYMIGAQSRPDYVKHVMSTVDELQECLRGKAGIGGIVSVAEQHEYGYPKPFYVANPYTSGEAPLIWKIVDSSGTSEDILRKFRQVGADVVVINLTRAAGTRGVFMPFQWSSRMLALYHEFCWKHMEVLCAPKHIDQKNGGFYAYRIVGERARPVPAIIYYMPGTEAISGNAIRLLKNKEIGRAIQEYLRLRRMFPDVGSHLDELAFPYRMLRQYELAFDLYRQTVEAGMVGEENLVGYAVSALQTGRYEKAVAGFARALDVHPDWRPQLRIYAAKAALLRGLELVRKKNSDEEARRVIARGLSGLEGASPRNMADELRGHLHALLAVVEHKLGLEPEALDDKRNAAKFMKGLDRLSFKDIENEFFRAEKVLRDVR